MDVVSKSDFARVVKISRSAVSKLIARGKIPETDMGIDLDNPFVQAYIQARKSPKIKKATTKPKVEKKAAVVKKKKQTKKAVSSSIQTSVSTKDSTASVLAPVLTEEEIKESREEARKTASLKFKKLAAQTRQIELKNAESENSLVSRDLIKKGIIDPIETFFVRLLSEGSRSIAAKLHAQIRGGATVEDVEEEIRKRLTAFIRPTKTAMVQALKGSDA
jgi:hypothetical protein